ncbi:MAG: collagen binding domain-containing protein [Blautia sp.]
MKKQRKSHSEINYWQSNTDMMTGLVLILVLIILLLILYLMQIPEDTLPDAEEGDGYTVDNQLGDAMDDDYDAGGDYDNDDDDDWDGAGGRDGGEEEYEEEENEDEDDESGGGGGDDYGGDYEFPYPPTSGDEWGKAAVYATVVDEETGRAIRQAGITFELYEEEGGDDGGSLRFLNTYYPEKKEYRNYATTEAGVFYLPEKIDEGNYYFKQISEVEGYDLAEAVNFEIDDVYDWPDPYVVSIAISPAKNIIPVELTDVETQEPIPDGTFKVTAAEDIITSDETLRYAKEETADTISMDEDGRGQSKELYLGSYIVSQDEIPKYYASIESTAERTVEEKDGSTPAAVKFSCEKTKIELSLSDEVYTSQKLEGAEFTLTCENYPELDQEAETDANGELVFTDLEKNRTYKLRQISAPDDYRFDDAAVEITVTEDGRIDGETKASFEFTNYIPRVNINVTDKLMNKPVSDYSLSLYREDGELIRTWTTNGTDVTFENLSGGGYYILLNGDEEKKYEFDFSEDEALQEFSVSVWTMQNIIVILIGCGAVLTGMAAAIVIIRKKIKKRSGKEMSREK